MKVLSSLFALLALTLVCWTATAEDKPAEALPVPELPAPDAEGWITLFNGKDLTGWVGNTEIWKVENGYISGKIADQKFNTFLIYNRPFKNFVIEAKFMLIPGEKDGKKSAGNSGIQYRSKVFDTKKFIVGGYQADFGGGYWGSLYDEKVRGKLLFIAGADIQKLVKQDDWNSYEITADGTKLKHVFNGTVSGELDDKDPKGTAEGIIALQYHAPGSFEVRFKDIRIKILPDPK